ncbi:MAG: hypothetical protein K0U22_06275 [Bacteroidetes bacterium]|jgi:hypothetical protein|nr:hypothetical protein [Bacteroidota bacterium]
MRKVVALVVLGAAVAACDAPKETSTVSSVFEKNCETIRTVVDNLQNDVADFQYYSEDFVGAQTRFNSTGDSTRLEEFKTNRLNWLEIFDAELTTPLNLLPGVNPQTNEPDGSVRYYGKWNITRTATDSTEAKSVLIPLYVSFDFDEEGKILFQQNYGDLTAAFESLNN